MIIGAEQEFWILTTTCGSKLEHENEATRFRVLACFHIYWSKSKIIFDACVDEGCSAPLTVAHEKQT
jgi:hypothetical protein